MQLWICACLLVLIATPPRKKKQNWNKTSKNKTQFSKSEIVWISRIFSPMRCGENEWKLIEIAETFSNLGWFFLSFIDFPFQKDDYIDLPETEKRVNTTGEIFVSGKETLQSSCFGNDDRCSPAAPMVSKNPWNVIRKCQEIHIFASFHKEIEGFLMVWIMKHGDEKNGNWCQQDKFSLTSWSIWKPSTKKFLREFLHINRLS